MTKQENLIPVPIVSDHDLARFLGMVGALNNYHVSPGITVWIDRTDRPALSYAYTGEGDMVANYFVRPDLLATLNECLTDATRKLRSTTP